MTYNSLQHIFTTMIGFVTWPPFSHHHHLLYKAEKPSVCPSVFFPHQADNSAISASIDAGLAQNQSYVLWHLKVYL